MACYFPDGSQSNDIPCNTQSNTSACCNERSVCLSNGYCLSQHDKLAISRQSCTDKNWGEGCPKYCRDVNPQRLTALFLARQGGTHKPNTFCCDAPPKTNGLCQAPTLDVNSSPFSIPDGLVVYNRSTGDTVNSLPGSPDPASSHSAGPVLVSAPPKSSIPTEVGIGVSLGVLLLIFMALFAWQFTKGRRLSKRIQELEKEPLVEYFQKSRQSSRATSTYAQSRSQSLTSAKNAHSHFRSQSSSHSQSRSQSQSQTNSNPHITPQSNPQSQNELGIYSPQRVHHYSREDFGNTPFLVENTKPRPELDYAFAYVEMPHTDRQELPT